MSNYQIKLDKLISKSKKEKYIDVLKNKFSKYEKVCIFGCGNIGISVAKEFLKREIKVDSF
jgi:hypothetical protein